MKGQFLIHNVPWTIVLGLVAVVSILILLLLIACTTWLPFCPFCRTDIAYALTYLDVTANANTMAALLKSVDVDGTPFMTYVYRGFAKGGFTAEEKKKAADASKKFLDKYSLVYYELTLETDKEKVGIAQSGGLQRCGPKLEGRCRRPASQYTDTGALIGSCNVGRIEIDGGANACDALPQAPRLCCAEAGDKEYHDWLAAKYAQPELKTFSAVRCGDSGQGICEADECHGGIRMKEGDSVCGLVIEGKNLCCCSTNPDILKDQGRIGEARIPLFYKDSTGYLVVSTSG